jgi:putative membrane protein
MPVSLLLGTVLLRPYVFFLFLAYLGLAVRDLGGRRAALFTVSVWPVALLAELSSTRAGIPFGLYHYTGLTRGQELFIADVPFFDSLSFTFLAYAAFCLARAVLGRDLIARPSAGAGLAVLSGALMMLLDVVIDPVAVRGDRWFLGYVFWYPSGGAYFGVPLSNFAGWIIVGAVGVGGYLLLARRTGGHHPRGGVGLYYAVVVFNLAVTAWIGEWILLAFGVALHLLVGVALIILSRRSSAGFAGAILGGGIGRGA